MVVADKNESQVLIYDAVCRFCASLARWLSRADVFQRVTWTPYQSLEMPPPGLSWVDLERSAYLVGGPKGRHIEGFHAFRMLTVRLPLLIPLAPIFWFPGMGVIGAAVYRWVARNRHRIFGCNLPASARRRNGQNPRPEPTIGDGFDSHR